AVVSAAASVADAARALADDVVPFDQRGCLSPRVALVEGDDARAEEFARALHAALSTIEREIPLGTLDDDERAAAARYAQMMPFAGALLQTREHLVGAARANS